MIPDEEIAQFRSFAADYPQRENAIIRVLLAERELLVAEHKTGERMGAVIHRDVLAHADAWQAVEDFK